MDKEWDVFISHASEDKYDIVEPLANELKGMGLKVWFDKSTLRIGDSLRRKIDEGLANSRFGIVVFSHAFFNKQWPTAELNGLVQKEIILKGKKVILPIYHKITQYEVAKYSPLLSDKLALNSSMGIPAIAKEIYEVIVDEGSNDNNEILFQGTKEIDVEISYKKLEINQLLHQYSLVFNLVLNRPPAIKNFRLYILWPSFIRISNLYYIKKGKERILDEYLHYNYELWIDYKEVIYPGERVSIISPMAISKIEYEFDEKTWHLVNKEKISLYYKIYFEDNMPIEGRVSFADLNFF